MKKATRQFTSIKETALLVGIILVDVKSWAAKVN